MKLYKFKLLTGYLKVVDESLPSVIWYKINVNVINASNVGFQQTYTSENRLNSVSMTWYLEFDDKIAIISASYHLHMWVKVWKQFLCQLTEVQEVYKQIKAIARGLSLFIGFLKSLLLFNIIFVLFVLLNMFMKSI